MDALEKIFNSPAQVKIMRLFLYSADTAFDLDAIKNKTQISSRMAGRVLHRLFAAGFIKQKSVAAKSRASGVLRRRTAQRRRGWILDPRFLYLEQFKNLLMSCHESERAAIAKKFLRAGRIKLLAISGVFLQSEASRVDILLVGDHFRQAVITQALKAIEANVGKDLRYAVMDTKDFLYRLSIYDRFVRDILDYPHEKLIDKFGLR